MGIIKKEEKGKRKEKIGQETEQNADKKQDVNKKQMANGAVTLEDNYNFKNIKRKDFVLRTNNFNIYFNDIKDWVAFLENEKISKKAFLDPILGNFTSKAINKKRNKYINEFNKDILNISSGRMVRIKELNDISLEDLKIIFELLHLSVIIKKESKVIYFDANIDPSKKKDNIEYSMYFNEKDKTFYCNSNCSNNNKEIFEINEVYKNESKIKAFNMFTTLVEKHIQDKGEKFNVKIDILGSV